MSVKTVRNIREPLKKPRPLKSSTSLEFSRDVKDCLSPKARADLLAELEMLNVRISNCDLDEVGRADIALMCSRLKKHGEELDSLHKDALDRFFCTLRNACREDKLDVLSRLKLLEIIELRTTHWKMNENTSNYFNSRYSQLEDANERQAISGSISPNALINMQNQSLTSVPSVTLAPGEFLRSSGKFSKPTKIAGKNYLKDEIVIRNCDSGKVMGIKGRRVHMIEELSDTVISFQRVNAGARDRLVQITGPDEDSISHAKYLLEDTIKRNVSPIRDNVNMPELDSKNQFEYGNSLLDNNNQFMYKRSLTHSLSMGDASARDMCVSVQVGQDVITLSGTKPELLKTAKHVLLEFFDSRFNVLEKESTMLFHSKSASSINNNQRFILKKQTSVKGNVSGSISAVDHGFSRQSSSMSSSSDEILPDEDTCDLEAFIPPVPAPIPPPVSKNPEKHTYSRELLLQCSLLPLSQKCPSNYEHITAGTPEIVPQAVIEFEQKQAV